MSKEETLNDIRNKLAKNPYTSCIIDYNKNQIVFYYNCKDNAILTLIEASEISNKIIYEEVYTYREQYKLTIYFETICNIEMK